MSDSDKAVFLSYASQDAQAAQRICDALRAAGVEVWFDKNELVGGDAWDQKIRRQIKECALLIPIVSVNTQARTEGYFRLEWRLADQRTHLMAKGRPFLLPVVIDDTNDAEAHVPDSFLEVQWTRLRPAGYGGQARPADGDSEVAKFAARVKTLLTTEPRQLTRGSRFKGEWDSAFPPPVAVPVAETPKERSRALRWILSAGIAAVAVALVLAIAQPWKPRGVPARSEAAPQDMATAPAATPAMSEERQKNPAVIEALKRGAANHATSGASGFDAKSVAVLAFANLSDDKSNEYFSDGVSEELLNVLAKVPGLKVPARTSAFHFKGKDTPVPEIGRQLGVAYVVEGSVRRAGEKVRITAQLIKAADGFRVWSDTFTRDLKDIFAVQDEIAGLIAQQLQLKLGATATAGFDNTSPEAYQLFLEARPALALRTRAGYERAEELLQQAIALSPRFAGAHAGLGIVWELRTELVESDMAFSNRAGPANRKIEAKIREALALDPQSAEAHAGLGLLCMDRWRFDEGAAALEQAIRLNPNYASAYQWLGRLRVNQGRVDDGLAALQRAVELDPLAPRILDNYARVLLFANRPAESLAMAERALELQPNAIQAAGMKALAQADLGQPEAALATLRGLPLESLVAYIHPLVLARCGQMAEVERLLAAGTIPGVFGRFTALVVVGRIAEALDLFRADDMNTNRLDFLLCHPAYDPVRGEARFQDVLKATNLTQIHATAQAWRATQAAAKTEAGK